MPSFQKGIQRIFFRIKCILIMRFSRKCLIEFILSLCEDLFSIRKNFIFEYHRKIHIREQAAWKKLQCKTYNENPNIQVANFKLNEKTSFHKIYSYLISNSSNFV